MGGWRQGRGWVRGRREGKGAARERKGGRGGQAPLLNTSLPCSPISALPATRPSGANAAGRESSAKQPRSRAPDDVASMGTTQPGARQRKITRVMRMTQPRRGDRLPFRRTLCFYIRIRSPRVGSTSKHLPVPTRLPTPPPQKHPLLAPHPHPHVQSRCNRHAFVDLRGRHS